MRYKVGDKVRVRRDLETAVMYGVLCATYEMLKEKIVTIKSVHDGYYKVVEDDYKWTDEMFEGLAEEELTAEEATKILGEICCGNESCGGCPRCGTKAYLSRDVVDGFYFGWSADCPRYCHYDGIHGTTIDTSEKDCYAVHGANSKEEAIEIWNNRVEHLRELDQQIGYEKIFEEMQINSLR